jgi:hypothetical protein
MLIDRRDSLESAPVAAGLLARSLAAAPPLVSRIAIERFECG